MTDLEPCNGCSHADDCKRIYEKLGQTQEPSVTWKVLVVFALPLIVFIVLLGLSDSWFSNTIIQAYRPFVTFALALTGTALFMWIVRWVLSRLHKSM